MLFLLLLLSSLSFAQDGSPMKTVDTIKIIDQLNSPDKVNCHPEQGDSTQSEYHRKREGFAGQVSCQLKCVNGSQEIVTMNNTFTNEAMELSSGDGGFHASFNITLDLWLDSICLSLAENTCGSKENIEVIELINLTSGQWSYDGPKYCPTLSEAKKINHSEINRSRILPDFKESRVPFETTSGAIQSTAPSNFSLSQLDLPETGFDVERENNKIDPDFLWQDYYFSESFLQEHSQFYESDDLTVEEIKAYALKVSGKESEKEFINWRIKEKGIDVKSCERSIKVDACYGDCMRTERGDIAIMGSNIISENNLGQKVVCADNLFKFFLENNIPQNLYKNYCRIFLNQTFSTTHFTGTSCSSFRFRDPCEKFFSN